ncbi:hypothetical protein BHE74_00057481 [Ensete ventricosum]|nr:hypothetical protein BHE74_00057481 [Ensete ventricosum]RZS17580.1 hypothetical protein BHM03_00049739 [Ensete ventricosum]
MWLRSLVLPVPQISFCLPSPLPFDLRGSGSGQAEMSVSSDTRGAGRKLPRRLGGMAEALAIAIASDLGVPIPAVQVINLLFALNIS